MKILIIFFQVKFLRIFKNYIIYGRESFFSKESKNIVVIEEDLHSASDYREADHLASCYADQILDRVINKEQTKFLSQWGGETFASFFLEKEVVKQATKVFQSFHYAEQVSNTYKLNGKIYIFPKAFAWKIYKTMRSMDLLPERIKLHPAAILYILSYSVLKFFYFFLKTLLYPEIVFFRVKSNKQNNKKVTLNSCVYLQNGLINDDLPLNRFFDDKIFKLFSKKDVIFINENEKNYKWEEMLRNEGWNIFKLDEFSGLIGKLQYLRDYYFLDCVWRIRLLVLALRSPWLVQECYASLRDKILWQLFYRNYSVKNVIKMMVAENLTSSIVHKKNSVKTTFLYFSTTESVVKERINKEKSSCHEYYHMISDYVVSSRLSNSFIKSLECSVGQYINIGPIFREISYEANVNKKDYFNKLNIPKNSKVISFLDHTAGNIGVFNSDAYKKFLNTIIHLADKNKDIYFLFKSKKEAANLNRLAGFDITEIIDQIRFKVNSVYANDYEINSLEIIGISDLVVSAPMSSVIFESLSAGVRTISFDPEAQYRDFSVPSQKIPYLSAYSLDELEKLINRWLFETNDAQFQAFLNEHLLPYIEINRDESSIEQFQLFLKECQLNEA